MPYVSRKNGKINGVFNKKQKGNAEEFLQGKDPEVIAFLNPPPTALQVKKETEIAALGDRATLLAEVAAMNNTPQIRAVVRKLADIVYSLTKGTIN